MHKADPLVWTFSASIYRQPGVAEECLSLQDRFGVDINVLLFCIHAASEFGALLSSEEVSAAHGAIAQWQTQVVHGLRKVRRILKESAVLSEWRDSKLLELLRAQIGNAELESERIEAIMLTEWCKARLSDWPRGERAVAITYNCQSVLAHYCVDRQTAFPQRLIKLTLESE